MQNNIINSFYLQRLVSVNKFIAERGLALRGDDNVGAPRNVFQKKFQNILHAS